MQRRNEFLTLHEDCSSRCLDCRRGKKQDRLFSTADGTDNLGDLPRRIGASQNHPQTPMSNPRPGEQLRHSPCLPFRRRIKYMTPGTMKGVNTRKARSRRRSKTRGKLPIGHVSAARCRLHGGIGGGEDGGTIGAVCFGQWAPAFLLFGIYNKLVKQLDRSGFSVTRRRAAPAPCRTRPGASGRSFLSMAV